MSLSPGMSSLVDTSVSTGTSSLVDTSLTPGTSIVVDTSLPVFVAALCLLLLSLKSTNSHVTLLKTADGFIHSCEQGEDGDTVSIETKALSAPLYLMVQRSGSEHESSLGTEAKNLFLSNVQEHRTCTAAELAAVFVQ